MATSLLPSSLTVYTHPLQGFTTYTTADVARLPRGLGTLDMEDEAAVKLLPPSLTVFYTASIIERSAIAHLPRTLTSMGDLHFRIWGDLIAALPPNLTSIGTAGPSAQSSFINVLPTGLVALKVDWVPGGDIIWPNTLRRLYVSGLGPKEAAILPSTLEDLSIFRCEFGWKMLPLLPRNLKKLNIRFLQHILEPQRAAIPGEVLQVDGQANGHIVEGVNGRDAPPTGVFSHLENLEMLSLSSPDPLHINIFYGLSSRLDSLALAAGSVPLVPRACFLNRFALSSSVSPLFPSAWSATCMHPFLDVSTDYAWSATLNGRLLQLWRSVLCCPKLFSSSTSS